MQIPTTSQPAQATPSGANEPQATLVSSRAVARVSTSYLAPVLVLLAVAIFDIFTLRNFPTVFIDESWNANRAWTFLHTGQVFASVDSGVFQQYDGYWTYWPYLGTLIHAAFIWAFGLSVESIRLASVLFGLILLIITYTIARKLYGPRTAIVAMALLAISAPFILSSHMGRHDIIVAALGFGAVALYLTDRKTSISLKSVLSGLAVGIALDIHLNIVVFGVAIAVLYLLEYKWKTLRTGRFWGYVLGGSLGLLYFVAGHILPYPQTYFAIASIGNGGSHTPPILSANPDIWRWSIINTINLLDLLLIPVLVPAVILLVRRRSDQDKTVMALAGLMIVGVAALISYKQPHYAILIAPAISLVLAPYIVHITEKAGRIREWAFWRNVLVLSAITLVAVINLAPVLHGSDAEFQSVLSYLGQTIPKGSVVYGSPTYWFALPDSPYIDWEQIVFRQRSMAGSTFTDAAQAIKPDYLVIDGFMETSFIMDDDTCHATYKDIPCIPKAELDNLLKQRGTLAGESDRWVWRHSHIQAGLG